MRYSDQQDAVFTLTTGPVPAYPGVLLGLARPVSYDSDPAFQRTYQRAVEKAKTALRTRFMPAIIQGEPVLGLEAAAASLIGRDDVVLNLASGVYGKGFVSWVRRYAKDVVELEVPFNEAIDPAEVAAALRERSDVTVVAVCHHDTPSGTLNPINEIGRIVADHGAYLLVDAVSSFGGMDVDPDSCHADLFVTGANKCLGCPPGLTLLGVSDRGWAKMEANPTAPRGSFLGLLGWKEAWRPGQPFPFTPSVSEINGLEAALDLYLAEGPERVWARHALTARACREGVKALGLTLWPASEAIASPTTTAVRLPEGIDEAALRAIARERYGVALPESRGAMQGKLIRVGHMGVTAQPLFATIAVAALGGALRALGHPVDLGAGLSATVAVIDAAGD